MDSDVDDAIDWSVSVVDTDQDGFADTVLVDTNGDHLDEVALTDDDRDGDLDSLAVDYEPNNVLDAKHYFAHDPDPDYIFI